MKVTRKRFLGGMAALGSMGWRAFAAPARKQRGYTDTTWWDPYVENITDSDTYLRRKFRQDVTDKTTGIDTQAIRKRLAQIVSAGKASGEPWRITKAKCFAAQALEMSIDVSPLDWFPAISIWNRHDRPIYGARGGRHGEMNAKLPAWVRKEWHEGNRDGTWNMWQDFDHSVPDWRVILKLGFPGMRARLEKYASGRDALPRVRNGQDARCPSGGDPFYEGLKIAMDAMMAGLDRFIEQGKKRLNAATQLNAPSALNGPSGLNDFSREATFKAEGPFNILKGEARFNRLKGEIACLERLRKGPPQTAYDMMMFVWLYFFWSEHLDGFQCRSLTELDVFLTPYYDADIAAGRTTEAEFREHLKHFLWQWGSISNYWNQPVGLGGTNADGTSAFNHVSKIILDVMDECNLTTPKFLVKIAPNTPDWAMDKMMDMARRHRSLSFTGEVPLLNALKKWQGASDDDCRKAVMTGCYEFQFHDGANQTGVGHVNFLKPIEKMLAEAAGTAAPHTAAPNMESRHLGGWTRALPSRTNTRGISFATKCHALREI